MFDIALQILGLTVGLVYLYYEYHASHKVWIAGLVMPCVSMFVYFRKGLYADFGMNIYYLLMAVYGYLAWTGKLRIGRGRKQEAPLRIRHMPVADYLWLIPAAAVLWVAIALFLLNATDSTVPWADAFTTALSIVGTWMLARKYLEQWLAWILVDTVCVGLYLYKEIYPYAALYAVYTVVALLGYLKWRRLMRAA
ncbi:MAG: nicotinamide riboside transporter PnuC [Muribaculaceae bacterium]|nr:nicotinamide riboside transporter PnuC [Muribaculaceae bacterium]